MKRTRMPDVCLRDDRASAAAPPTRKSAPGRGSPCRTAAIVLQSPVTRLQRMGTLNAEKSAGAKLHPAAGFTQ